MAKLTWTRVIVILSLVMSGLPGYARAQDDAALELFVRRNVGYAGVGEIQGSYRLEATGPSDLTSVTFYIDDIVVGTDSEAPYRVDFDTDAYPLGMHDLHAEGTRTNGDLLRSNTRSLKFVSAAESWQAMQAILVPLLAILGGVLLLVVGMTTVQIMRGKRNPVPLGAPRRYGLMGGTICPKCGRPFSRHWWGLNAGLGKLDRCDHCGKWSIVRAQPLDKLRAAEAAELKDSGEGAGTVAALSPEEQLRKQIDDSRFSD